MNGEDGRGNQDRASHKAENGITMPPVSLVSRVQELQDKVTNMSGSSSNPSSSTASRVGYLRN